MFGLGPAHALSLGASRPLVPPFVGALDAFTPTYAWSHRRALVSSFEGNILQARRTSDSEPYNVARLANGEGNIAGLQSFVGSGSATVASLTEQMGTGVNFLQTTGDNQRIIVDAGSLVTVGGKAASRGTRTGSNNVVGGGMVAATTYTGTTMSVFIRGRTDALTGAFIGINAPLFVAGKNDVQSGQGQFITLFGPTDANGVSVVGNDAYMVNAQPYATDYLISIICDGSTLTFKDGTYTYTYALTRAFDINKFLIGCLTESYQDNGAAAVKIQELVIYKSDQTSNESAIRSALMA